jgi:DNA-binding beta-propeller fold protein YncE
MAREESAPTLAIFDESLLTPAISSSSDRPPPYLPEGADRPTAKEAASGLESSVADVAYTTDGRFLLTAGYGDFTVRLWDGDDGRQLQLIRMKHRPRDVAVTPDGQSVVVGDVYAHLTIFPLHSSGHLGWSRMKKLESSDIWGLAISPGGQLLVVTSWDKTMVILDPEDLSVVHQLTLSAPPRRPIFSPSGELLAVGTHHNTFLLWDLISGKGSIYTVPRANRLSDVGSVAFSPEGKYLATGHMDSTITIWDVQRRRLLHNFFVRQVSTYDVAFSPGGDVLATAGQDGAIRLWEPATRKRRAVLKGHTKAATRLAFHPHGKRLVSVGEDGRILFWDTATMKEAPEPMDEEDLLDWNLQQLPEAAPVVRGLQALISGDHTRLRTVLTDEALSQLDRLGWNRAVAGLRRAWRKGTGDTDEPGVADVTQLHMTFSGTSSAGKLVVSRDDRILFEVPLVRQHQAWKANPSFSESALQRLAREPPEAKPEADPGAEPEDDKWDEDDEDDENDENDEDDEDDEDDK